MGGWASLYFHLQGKDYEFVKPSTVRKTVGLKIPRGTKQTAKKKLIVNHVNKVLKQETRNHNEADALNLLYYWIKTKGE